LQTFAFIYEFLLHNFRLPSDTRSISRRNRNISLTMSSWVKFGLTTKADNAIRHLSKSLSLVFQKMKFYLEENYVSQPIFSFRLMSLNS